MDIYRHQTVPFADGGLQLRLPVDKVPPTQYSRLNNVETIVEGKMQVRGAINPFVSNLGATSSPGSGVHSIFRLNQPTFSVQGERLLGLDTSLLSLNLPSGTAPTNLSSGLGTYISGNPLTITSVRELQDTAAWGLISDRQGMWKRKNGYTQNLGIQQPFGYATASVGGGPGITGNNYDWRYTYYNRYTGDESNPSPITPDPANSLIGQQVEIISPTAFTNPDPGFGGSAFTNPSNPMLQQPIGQPLATFAIGDSSGRSRQSCKWSNFAAIYVNNPPYAEMYLTIDAEFIITGGETLNASGCAFAAIYYSLDGGTSWHTAWDTSVTTARNIYVMQLPTDLPIGNIQVRAVVDSSYEKLSPQNITFREIRAEGGNLDTSSFSNNGTRTSTLKIYNIEIWGFVEGVTTLNLVAQKAEICALAPTDPQVTDIRLYRRGGSLPESWFMVGQYDVSTLARGICGTNYLQIEDAVDDNALGQEISLTNDAPVTSQYRLNVPLEATWGPFNGYVLGCGDPDRPDVVYYSNPSTPGQWGSPNWTPVTSGPSEPLLNGCVYNTRCFAFSGDRLYELLLGAIAGTTFAPFPTPVSRGLVGKWAFCVGDAIYFVAKDGIYRTTGGIEQSITFDSIQPLFPTGDQPGQAVGDYQPVDITQWESIRLAWWNDELYFAYPSGVSGMKCLIYNTKRNRWRALNLPGAYYQPSVFYGEPSYSAFSLLMGNNSNGLYQFGSGAADGIGFTICSLITGAFDQGLPLNTKEYGNVIFDLDPGGGTVTITPYINGGATPEAAITVTGSGRQQVPLDLSDVIAYNLEFQIDFATSPTVNPILYQFDILWREEPVYTKHFEVRETAHDLAGYQFIRDGYVSIRSTADVVLTLTFDNTTTQTYTITSTGGERKKVYLPLHPNKFKQVHYSFDSVEQFKLYQIDSEIRLRMWNVPFDYVVRKPFGADSTLTTAALQAQALRAGSQ